MNPIRSIARASGLLTACTLSAVLASCQVRPHVDPQLTWEYTVKSVGPEAQPANSALPVVHLDGDRAPLGNVIREIAKQAGISIVFPAEFDTVAYTGRLVGSADALLDAIARRSDFRFSLNNGVGFIGKPLPEDRSVGVLRTWLDTPTEVITPLLSEGGKVTASGGYAFISDRSEIVYRVISALRDARPRIYAVQVLEIYTADSFDLSASITNARADGPPSYSPDIGFAAQVTASLKDSGSYLGRTWTGLVTEGKKFTFLQGSAEKRTESIVNISSPIVQNETFVSTGWHFDVQISAGAAYGEIYQDATDQAQYKVPFQTPNPGLFLVNASTVDQVDRQAGIPDSYARSGHFVRHLWFRYHLVGQLLDVPPAAVPAAAEGERGSAAPAPLATARP